MKRYFIGITRGFQTDNRTGLLVPGTYFENLRNTIQNDLKYYLAYKMGTNTTDQAMNNLFTVGGAIGGGHAGEDGMAHGTGGVADYAFVTTLNAGGDNSAEYIEFYGYIVGAVTLNNNLYLGFNMQWPGQDFAKTYAEYDINTSVGAGRTFHFYWKITVTS
jgi:hypothetical protein